MIGGKTPVDRGSGTVVFFNVSLGSDKPDSMEGEAVEEVDGGTAAGNRVDFLKSGNDWVINLGTGVTTVGGDSKDFGATGGNTRMPWGEAGGMLSSCGVSA